MSYYNELHAGKLTVEAVKLYDKAIAEVKAIADELAAAAEASRKITERN